MRNDLKVERCLSVFRASDVTSESNRDERDLPDDFYEVTEADFKGMVLSKKAEEPIMQTAAMRELQTLTSMPTYDRALVRVRIPGEIFVQAAFHPQESVVSVLDLVRDCLSPLVAKAKLYLFTTPPRRALTMSSSLAREGLLPAANVVLGFEDNGQSGLTIEAPEQFLSPAALVLLRTSTGAAGKVIFPRALPLGSSSSVPAPPSLDTGFGGSDTRQMNGPEHSTSRSHAKASASASKVKEAPKWFRR